MPASYSHVETCFEVTDEIIDEALADSVDLHDPTPGEKVFALLEHMAQIALPKQGSARILVLLGRLSRCEWLDGTLEIRLTAREQTTALELLVNDGLSLSKLRTLTVGAPYEEFRKFLARPDAIAPLVVQGTIGATKTRLSGTGDAPPPVSKPPTRRSRQPPAPRAAPPARTPPPDASQGAPLPPPPRAPMGTMLGVAEPAAGGAAPPPPPPRERQETLLGVAEPAILGRILIEKRLVPASRPAGRRSSRAPAAPKTKRPPPPKK